MRATDADAATPSVEALSLEHDPRLLHRYMPLYSTEHNDRYRFVAFQFYDVQSWYILDDAGETEPSSFWSLTVVTRTQAPSYFGRSRRSARHHNTTLLAHLFTCAPPLTRRRARDMLSQQTIYALGQGMNPVAK